MKKLSEIKYIDEIWPHLRHVDERFHSVLHYLAPRARNMTVVDLDCGDSRILRYWTPKYYIGNDLVDSPEGRINREGEWCQFHQKPDHQMAYDKIDVLMAWGMGGHEISNEEVESPTLTQTIMRLTADHQPKYVVLEAIQDFDTILNYLTAFLLTKFNYYVRIDERINIQDIREFKRHVILFEKMDQ